MLNEQMKEQQRQAEFWNDEIDLVEQAFVIIPFTVSGIKDYTNQGYVDNQVNPEDFETFKRIWTGNDSCILTWYKSVELKQAANKKISINFKLGDYILGNIIYTTSTTEIDKDKSFSDYTAQQIRKSYTFRVNAKRTKITDYHQLMMYKIPTLSKETVFRLSSIDKEFIGNKIKWYTLTFESINQDLANTGQARQQNINMSAIGQGYLNPVVMEAKDFNPTGLTKDVDYKVLENTQILLADRQKIKNNPATKVVVRALGNGIIGSVSFIGRPVRKTDNANKYNYQRLIFCRQFRQPSTPTLYRTQQNMTNCYYGKFSPTMQYWKDWLTNVKDSFNGINEKKYEGFVLFNHTALQKTNPENNGSYTYSLFNNNKLVGNVTKIYPWEINLENESNVEVYGSYGVESSYKISGNKAIHDRMWDNFWIQKNMIALPIDTLSTLTFGNVINAGAFSGIYGAQQKNWFLLGAGVAIFLIGMLASIGTKLNRPKPTPYFGIALAPFIDLNAKVYGTDSSTNLDRLPMSALGGDGGASSLFWSNETVNFSFEADLTDRFSVDYGTHGVRYYTTGNIGQKKDENNHYFFQDNTKPLLVKGVERLEPRGNDNDGYIIDQIQINAMFKGEYSIEFLNDAGDVIWTGIYQSQGKWTDSYREIWSVYDTSIFNRENIFVTEPEPYPARLPEPPTENVVLHDIVNSNLSDLIYVRNKVIAVAISNQPCQNSFVLNPKSDIQPASLNATIDLLTIPNELNINDLRANYRELQLKFMHNNSNTADTITFPISDLIDNDSLSYSADLSLDKTTTEYLAYETAKVSETTGIGSCDVTKPTNTNLSMMSYIAIDFRVSLNQSAKKITFQLNRLTTSRNSINLKLQNRQYFTFPNGFTNTNETFIYLQEAKLVLL